MKKMEWTAEKVAILTDRYKIDGPSKLAAEFGTTMWAVIAKARRLGLESTRKRPPKGFEWTQEKIEALEERYEQEGAKPFMEEWGVARDTIRHMTAKLGLHTNAGHVEWGKRRAEQSESCDVHYFDQWKPSMAYILGFLFADGNVPNTLSGIRVGLQEDDRSVLEFIKAELKATSEIKPYTAPERRNGDRTIPESRMARLVVCSVLIAKQLGRLGCHPGKTYRDDPLPEVPAEFFSHFARGNFDGDGTASLTGKRYCHVGFLGSQRLIEGIHERMAVEVGLARKTLQYRKHAYRNTMVAAFGYDSWADIRKFYDFIYPEGFGFCLERKRKILADWLEANPVQPKIGRPVGIKETKPRER